MQEFMEIYYPKPNYRKKKLSITHWVLLGSFIHIRDLGDHYVVYKIDDDIRAYTHLTDEFLLHNLHGPARYFKKKATGDFDITWAIDGIPYNYVEWNAKRKLILEMESIYNGEEL